MILGWYRAIIEFLPDWLSMPLGGCVFCFGTWVNIIAFVLTYQLDLRPVYFVSLFLCIGANYLGTVITLKLSNED